MASSPIDECALYIVYLNMSPLAWMLCSWLFISPLGKYIWCIPCHLSYNEVFHVTNHISSAWFHSQDLSHSLRWHTVNGGLNRYYSPLNYRYNTLKQDVEGHSKHLLMFWITEGRLRSLIISRGGWLISLDINPLQTENKSAFSEQPSESNTESF